MQKPETVDLSIIIPWSNRREIVTTLQENSVIFGAHDLEVIIVNCGGDSAQLHQATTGIQLTRLRCIELQDAEFNKALALNIGVYAARAPRLFFLDTDVILKEDFFAAVLPMLDTRCFVTVERVFESLGVSVDKQSQLEEVVQWIQLVATNNREAKVETNRARFKDGSRSAPGLVLLGRQHFIEIDGMNSDLRGWGWEDMDLLVRLQLALGLRQCYMGSAVHLTHGDEVRYFGPGGRSASEQLNLSICMENYRLGHFSGTYADDVKTWKDRITLHGLD